MEEIYMNIDPEKTVCRISVAKHEGSGSSKKRHYVGVIISLGLLNVFLLIGLISLGVFSLGIGSPAANLTKDILTDQLQASNYQLSAMTKERDRLNLNLTEMTNEVTRLQSLLKKKKTCPAGWRMFSCSCYFLSTTSGSWDEGKADCRNRGGDLVVINDDDEQKFVVTLTEKTAWIGLTDRETKGSWKWVDGTALSYELKKFWRPGQPDNYLGVEDCAQILENYKTWNDLNCDFSILWICEMAPV